MLRKLGLIGILLVLSLGLSAPAWAQSQGGSIFVKSADEQGAAVPGATITITGPVLPAAVTGVTDSSGNYRSPLVPVGTYTVKIVLQGFQTISRENVVVVQSQTVTLEFAMKVSTVNEEITVKGESPIVDTTKVNVNVNLDKKLLENTPGGKDIWSILEYKAPGVIFDQPDVGGNQAGLQRSMTARGTPNSQNTQMLNGVNVNDPAAQGFSMTYYTPSTFENVQISSGSQDITVGTLGVFMNMVTKSGTNRNSGMALQTYQGGPTQWDNIDTTLKNAGLRPEASAVDYITNTNGQFGGPIKKNSLFYFGSLNYQATHVNVVGFPAVTTLPVQLGNTSQQDTTDIIAGSGKMTYQLNQANRFEGYLEKQRYDKPNRGSGPTVTQDSDLKELDTFFIAQIAWNTVLTDKLFMDTKLSYNNTHFPLYQKTGLQSLNDQGTSPNTLLRNTTNTAIMFRRRLEFVSNFQYFVPEMLGGRHEFKGGIDNGYTPEAVDTLRVDDVNLNYSSVTGKGTTVTIFNSPFHRDRAVMTTALYGQDSYSIGRLSLIGGIRWERIEGYLPAQVTPASQYLPDGLVFQGVTINGVVQNFTVQKSFAEVRQDPLWHNFAPRVSGIYDLTGKGKTVLKASWGKYLDQINTGTPPNPNAAINQTYVWNDANNDLNFQPGNATWDGTKYVGGEFGALNSTSNLAVATFDKSLRRPFREETTAGIDHEVVPGVRASATFIYRRERDVQGTVDQSMDQWPNQFTPIALTDPGRDGVLGTADDAPITVYNQNAGIIQSQKTVNDDRLATKYKGLELTVERRYRDGWNVLAGYNLGYTTQELVSLNNPNNVFVNAGGEAGGRRHQFKLNGSYTFKYQIVTGVEYRIQSGLPITRTWQTPTCSASVTTNCTRQGATVNAEERGTVLLPVLQTLDVRAGRFFQAGSHRIELSMDVYNLMNANTTYAVRPGSSSNVTNTSSTGVSQIRVAGDPNAPLTPISSFLSPTGVLGPRIIRFNVTYWFQ